MEKCLAITKHPSIKQWMFGVPGGQHLKFYHLYHSKKFFRKFPPMILVKIYHLTFSKDLQFSIFSLCIWVITPPPSPCCCFFFGGGGGGANSTRSFSTSSKNEKIMDPTPRPRTCSKGCCATQRSPLDHDFGEKSSDSSEMDDFADFSRHLQWRQGEAGPLKRPKSRVSSPRSTSMVVGGELVNRSNARADEPKPKQNPHAWYEPKQVGWLQPNLYEWKMGWKSPTSSIWKYSCLGSQDYITKHWVKRLP